MKQCTLVVKECWDIKGGYCHGVEVGESNMLLRQRNHYVFPFVSLRFLPYATSCTYHEFIVKRYHVP